MQSLFTQIQGNDDITSMIAIASDGNNLARDKLYAYLYPRLRKIAARQMRSQHELTLLDATSLLHETLIRMLNAKLEDITSGKHLVSYGAKIMRSVIVDYVRQQQSQKRYAELTGLTDVEIGFDSNFVDVLALNEGLQRLTLVDERLTTIVEMRCFAGHTVDEIALELDVSPRTIKRDWQKACAFIKFFISNRCHDS
jgi:RNA polymerase sigma factor (TIGR02999 family)